MTAKNTDRLLLELLFDKRKSPLDDDDISLKLLLKVLKKTPEFKKQLEEALKAMEPPKKDDKKDKDKLSFGQKYMLATIAAVTIPPLYVVAILKLFTALGVH